MRIFVVLMCSLTLACVAYAQPEQGKPQKKKQGQAAQHVTGTASHPAAGAAANKRMPTAASGGQKPRPGQTSAYQPQKVNPKGKSQASAAAHQRQTGKRPETSNAYQVQKGKKNQTQVERQTVNATNKRQTAKAANAGQVKAAGKPNQAKIAAGQNAAKPKSARSKPVKAQHFNVPKQPNTAKAPAVKFQQGKHIQGSQSWQGARYTVFRNYSPQWHNQGWWHNHYNRIVFVFGAPYYWNAGYWFPAWGYYPNAYYAWDGPIYAYNNMPPDQVIANVQATLQQQGYYHGDVDGLIGPLTRGAIADYQRDNGLYVTSTIDQPTLQSLGMA
jgi:hypothetical protein